MRALLVISTNTRNTNTKIRSVRFHSGQDQSGNGANSALNVIHASSASMIQGIASGVHRLRSRENSQPPRVATAISSPNGWPRAKPNTS